uniref:B box-type domain-containing protein n=1 Tax=Oryza brachyantha TaxID=4533 RepID=J3MGI6_ORYBR
MGGGGGVERCALCGAAAAVHCEADAAFLCAACDAKGYFKQNRKRLSPPLHSTPAAPTHSAANGHRRHFTTGGDVTPQQ